MANNTTNYNLKKPLGTENYNVEDQNGNMDIIDAELKANADALATHEADDVQFKLNLERTLSMGGMI